MLVRAEPVEPIDARSVARRCFFKSLRGDASAASTGRCLLEPIDARSVARRCFLKRLCGDASAASTGLPPTELLVLMSTEFLVLLSKGTASANGACGLTRMCCRSHLLQAAQAAQATLAVHGCRKMDYACLLKFRSLASRRKTALTCLPLGSSEAVGILSQRTGSPSGHRQDRAPQRALERNTRSRTTHK